MRSGALPLEHSFLFLGLFKCISEKLVGFPEFTKKILFVRRELKIIPAKAIVIEYYSVNYGCKNCKEHGITPAIIKGKDGKAHMMYGMASEEVHLSGNVAGTFFTGRAKQLLRKIIHLLLEVVALPLEHSFLFLGLFKSNEERFKGIPVKKVFLEPSEEERICSKCGKQMDQSIFDHPVCQRCTTDFCT